MVVDEGAERGVDDGFSFGWIVVVVVLGVDEVVMVDVAVAVVIGHEFRG